MIEYVRKESQRNQEQIDRAGITPPASWLGRPGGPEERRTFRRFEVTAKVRLTVFLAPPGAAPSAGTRVDKLVRTGFTRDLSRRGACILLDSQVDPVPCRQLVGKDVKLRLELAGNERETLQLLGRVAWSSEQQGLSALGVEFTDIPGPELRILERCCQEDDGEMTRILNLWQVLVAEEESR